MKSLIQGSLQECINFGAKKINFVMPNGGERGIRTLGSIATTHAFQAC